MQFTGFTDADFDAYQRRKWASNVFNLERLQVKQKLELLGRQLAPRLTSADGSPLTYEVSAEHPALWNQHSVNAQYLFFSRNADARRELDAIISRGRSMASLVEDPSPLRHHIFLAVILDEHQVEVSLKLHADAKVDRENLERSAAEFFQREKLLAAITALPESFRIGIEGGDGWCPATALTDEALLQLVGALGGSESWLAISRGWARDDEAVASEHFADAAREALDQLLPLLHAIAWSRENDQLAMRDTLKAEDRKKKTKGLAKNDRVRITGGMLAGKTGVVQDASDKGEVKVLIGTLTLKVKSDALAKL
ncbi:MAG: hypothetical protein CSA65_02780 [Proteobacteria bacterium]|nr:MAG: hypothetical protein CSB49_01455 [Pseudomonadota bacterium]PIE19320.1 MAG: hypothetical protein CSA65_02780 [Pseudomonadota bacterium]